MDYKEQEQGTVILDAVAKAYAAIRRRYPNEPLFSQVVFQFANRVAQNVYDEMKRRQ